MSVTVEAPVELRSYGAVIKRMQDRLKIVREERLRASEQVLIDSLDAAVFNLVQAIELFNRAQKVPVETVQFGASSGRSLRVILPPGSPEFRFRPLIFNHYIYVTNEPVEILYLRDMIQNQGRSGVVRRIPGLKEMKVGLVAAISQDGELIDYFEPEMIEVLGRAKVLKSQIG